MKLMEPMPAANSKAICNRGFRGNSNFYPAQTSVEVVREVARNPLLHLAANR